MEYNTSLAMNQNNPQIHPKLKVIYPAHDSNLSILEDLVSYHYTQLFETTLYYNFILLLDPELSIVSYHINNDLMLSKIKLCEGLNFREENMGITSVSDAFLFKKATTALSHKTRNPIFRNLSNCTIPITLDDKTIAYIASFFLASKYDELSVRLFNLFGKLIAFNLSFSRLKISMEDYIFDAILPGFNPEILSKAEKEVLNYIKRGCSNKDISNSLFLSENTVGFHSKIIMEKLCCSNRTEVAVNTVLYELLKLIYKYN